MLNFDHLSHLSLGDRRTATSQSRTWAEKFDQVPSRTIIVKNGPENVHFLEKTRLIIFESHLKSIS